MGWFTKARKKIKREAKRISRQLEGVQEDIDESIDKAASRLKKHFKKLKAWLSKDKSQTDGEAHSFDEDQFNEMLDEAILKAFKEFGASSLQELPDTTNALPDPNQSTDSDLDESNIILTKIAKATIERLIDKFRSHKGLEPLKFSNLSVAVITPADDAITKEQMEILLEKVANRVLGTHQEALFSLFHKGIEDSNAAENPVETVEVLEEGSSKGLVSVDGFESNSNTPEMTKLMLDLEEDCFKSLDLIQCALSFAVIKDNYCANEKSIKENIEYCASFASKVKKDYCTRELTEQEQKLCSEILANLDISGYSNTQTIDSPE